METLDLLFLLTCNIMGIGIFSLAHYVLPQVVSCITSLFLVVISGAIATIFGLCYAELGATYPFAGGDKNYLSEAYSRHFGTAYSLISLVFILPLSCAVITVKIFECFKADVGRDIYASILLGCCSLLLAFGDELSKWIIRVLFVMKVIVVVFLAATSIFSLVVTKIVPNSAINDVRSSIYNVPSFNQIVRGLYFTQFSFDGWNCGNYIANRIRCPRISFPRAIVGSIWCAAFMYILINLSFMWIVPYDSIVNNELFLDEYFKTVGVPISSKILFITVTLIPTFGSLICSLTVGSGIMESFIAKKFTKRMNLLFFLTLSSTILLLVKFFDVKRMVSMITPCTMLFYCLSCFALFILKRRDKTACRQFSLPLPVPLIASVIGALMASYMIKVAIFCYALRFVNIKAPTNPLETL